jgi:competence protein ComEC
MLQNTGTAHLIAISGLHIGIIAGFCYLVAGYIWSFFLLHS